MENKDLLHRIFKAFAIHFTLLFLFNFVLLAFSYQNYPGFINNFFQAVSLATLTGYAPTEFYLTFSEIGSWIYWLLLHINVLFYLYYLALLFKTFSAKEGRNVTPAFQFKLFKDFLLFFLVLETIMLVPMYYVVSGTFQVESFAQKIHFCLMYITGALGNVNVNLLGSESVHFDPAGLLLFNMLLALGVFAGSLGLPVVRDLIHPKVLRHRLKHPETDWETFTKIALFGTVLLVVVSAVPVFINGRSDFFAGLPLLDQLFNSLFLPFNSRFGGIGILSMDQFDGIVFWIFLMLVLIGGGIFATTGGVNISTFYFILSKKKGRAFLLYLSLILLFQLLSVFVLQLILPDQTFKSLISLQFNTFFNAGWHKVDFPSDVLLLYTSVIMLLGRFVTFFAPWGVFIIINPAKLPEEIRE